MDIDLFTWIAQIVNFLILVWLLRHFLYGRIVGAIDAREDQIASRWLQAEQERDKASEEARSYAARREELQHKQDEILARAREDAEQQKQQWFQEAREEVETARGNWHTSLEKQQQSFLEDLRRMATKEIIDTVGRVLRDLADEDLERQTVQQFTKRLSRPDEQMQPLRDFLSEAGQTLTVSTAFDLSQEQRQNLSRTIRDVADKDVDIRFRTSRDLLSGVELRADGRKLAWSVRDYLDGLEERVRNVLEQRTAGQKKAAPQAEARHENG
jgi:F-type H+-transporting ATPase subunit b